MSGIFSANLDLESKISRTGEEDTTLWRLAVVSSQMSSEAVGDKLKEKAVNAGHWSTQLEGMVGDGDAPVVGEKRRAHKLDEMRRNKLRMDGEARNLPREELKIRAIMQRIDDACHTGWAEAAAQGPHSEGEYSSSHHKTATAEHKQGGFNGKGKEEAVEKGTIPVPEASSLARQQKHGEGGSRGLGAGAGGGPVRKKCPHNRQRSRCKECGGSGICEHNRQRSVCKLCCGGSSICKHNRRRSVCKQCGGSSLCQNNREKRRCKLCGGASICEHNREKCRGASNVTARASASTAAKEGSARTAGQKPE